MMDELYQSLEGLEILGIWANLPDIATYFEIFDDFLDFQIHPWDATGYDDGEMIPERKNALRLLLTAMQEYKMGKGEDPNLAKMGVSKEDQAEIYGKVVETKGTVQKGNKTYETTGREVVMKAPQKEDLEDWDWKKFAYPDDVKAYEKLKKEGRV